MKKWKNTCKAVIVFLNLFILFIYFWLRWVSVAAHGLSPVAASGGHCSLWCTGFSLQWPLLLQNSVSRRAGFSSCGLQALERRLSSWGARASLLRGVWDLPGPGLEPVSPELAGGFLTTAPPGKTYNFFYNEKLAKYQRGLNLIPIVPVWIFSWQRDGSAMFALVTLGAQSRVPMNQM